MAAPRATLRPATPSVSPAASASSVGAIASTNPTGCTRSTGPARSASSRPAPRRRRAPRPARRPRSPGPAPHPRARTPPPLPAPGHRDHLRTQRRALLAQRHEPVADRLPVHASSYRTPVRRTRVIHRCSPAAEPNWRRPRLRTRGPRSGAARGRPHDRRRREEGADSRTPDSRTPRGRPRATRRSASVSSTDPGAPGRTPALPGRAPSSGSEPARSGATIVGSASGRHVADDQGRQHPQVGPGEEEARRSRARGRRCR